MSKQTLISLGVLLVTSLLAIGAAEGILRVKNSSMRNYDIEMWRYSKELKLLSDNPKLGHDHVRNASATLQSVPLRINEWGLRGGPVKQPPEGRRILVLGGSITLGWGVPEEDILTTRLQKSFEASGQKVEVLNGGVGNYNAERYTERFFTQLAALKPTDIVVHYFLRDAEKLEPGGGNWFLRNSQLAVTLWIAVTRLANKSGEKSLLDHYRAVYDPQQPGFKEMKASLARIADYAKAKGVRIYLAMTPDVHNLKNYEFGFVHEAMRQIASEDGYRYVDLLPPMVGLAPEQLWAMPGDPHPNALGHKLMAEALYPLLKSAN